MVFKMMIEKYFGIERETAHQLIAATDNMKHEKSGDNMFQNTETFLFDKYAVLKSQNINVRNVSTQDPALKYYESIANTLLDLHRQGVNVVPILAFQVNNDGNGYIIQKRAKGAELYDRDKLDNKSYVLGRVKFLSNAPQAHFDKFVADTIEIMDAGVLVDCVGKDNFFYEETIGFQFIDLNAHYDYIYGLDDEKPDGKKYAFMSCFRPLSHCPYPFADMPKYSEIVLRLISELTDKEHIALREHNKTILEKCKSAAINNGIAEEIVNDAITSHKFILKMQQLELL
ncbi:MAG: hypothetical protein LBD23_18510 [Oscillospiraceae bacterium]|jgi:hypothetical protein|nr:hypothetical protein [Oscillospiraceae bacterium]